MIGPFEKRLIGYTDIWNDGVSRYVLPWASALIIEDRPEFVKYFVSAVTPIA